MRLRDATLLLVDDEPILLEIETEWFSGLAAQVLTANNGAEALKVLEATPVDVILTDVRMPVMDGITLLTKLRRMRRPIPSLVFLSGYTSISMREAFDLGAEAIMSKPTTRQDLVYKVEKVLMDKRVVWSELYGGVTVHNLNQGFASIAESVADGKLAFGRGGFCIHGSLTFSGEVMDLALDFKADRKRLIGKGIARWQDHTEEKIGIEIIYLEEYCRDWVFTITQMETGVFIPRDTSRIGLPVLLQS
jgi:CheY-like chemotaxis protein